MKDMGAEAEKDDEGFKKDFTERHRPSRGRIEKVSLCLSWNERLLLVRRFKLKFCMRY